SSFTCGDSRYSELARVSVTPPPTPFLSASLVTTDHVEIDLSWYASSGTESGYRIERAPDNGGGPGTWSQIATAVGTFNTSYADTNVALNATYWYRIRAYNAVGESPDSNEVSVTVTLAPPSAPYSISAFLVPTNLEVVLSWYVFDYNVAGYKI